MTRAPVHAPVSRAPRRASGAALSLGGLPVQLVGEDEGALARVRALLSQLFALDETPGEVGERGVRLSLSASPLAEGPGRPVYRAHNLQVTREVTPTGAGFFLGCGASTFRVTPGRGEARCHLSDDFFAHSPYEQREFFLLGLLMLLRPSGRFGLHACALERGGAGLLLVGASGSGKTTTSLSLIRRGWRYLSDDAVLLRRSGGAVQAFAFRKGFSCTPETLARFPELTGDPELGGAFGDPGGKRVVFPGPAFGTFTPACTPSLVVFPTVAGGPGSALRPLGAAHSLVRLSQQSAGIMTDTAVSQRQLALLQRLSAQAQGLELHLGRDALADPARVDTLLGERLEALCAS